MNSAWPVLKHQSYPAVQQFSYQGIAVPAVTLYSL